MGIEKQLLQNPDIFPSEEVLANALGKVYSVFDDFERLLSADEYALNFEWRHYKDGGWLCKAAYKKKTIFWLSIWEGYFQLGFFFLPRHLDDIEALEMDKNNFETEKEWGKMIPFIFKIRDNKPFEDLFKLVEYKKRAK